MREMSCFFSGARLFRSLLTGICLLALLFTLCACQNEPEPVGYYDAETMASVCFGYAIKTEECYFFVAADNTRDGHIIGKGDFVRMKQALLPDEVDLDVLKTGDYISIKVYTVESSYPGQAGIYELQVISHGELSDIPSAQVDEIKALGHTIIE